VRSSDLTFLRIVPGELSLLMFYITQKNAQGTTLQKSRGL
jgi:hypothetical protein